MSVNYKLIARGVIDVVAMIIAGLIMPVFAAIGAFAPALYSEPNINAIIFPAVIFILCFASVIYLALRCK